MITLYIKSLGKSISKFSNNKKSLDILKNILDYENISWYYRFRKIEPEVIQ